MSFLRGGGGRKMYRFFFTTPFVFKKCSWGPETQNKMFFLGGGGASENFGTIRLAVQKLSSGNLGGGRKEDR